MADWMTDDEAFAAYAAGQRVTAEHAIFKEEIDAGFHSHNWRTIVCHNGRDIVECGQCGKQRVMVCNFDDEYS